MGSVRTKEDEMKVFQKQRDGHEWQTKPLEPIEDLSSVLPYLLKEKFVVEINGHKYDLSFFLDKETGDIGYRWSSAPSPHLLSYEIIERAFREGKWFRVQESE